MNRAKIMDGNCITPLQAHGPVTNIIKVAVFILRAVGFMSFMVFILCLPLGDPEETCTAEVCKQQNVTTALAYNYVCTVYKVLTTTLNYTSATMQEVSEYTGCFILEAMHGVKLKFYNFLTAVDHEELCRTVCCQEDADHEVEPSRHHHKETKKNCKCKAKCCKRQ